MLQVGVRNDYARRAYYKNMLNQIQLKRQLFKSRDELEGFTLKNKSIFYEANESQTINLTGEESLSGNGMQNESHPNQVFRWSAKEFDYLLSKQKIDLNSFLNVNEKDYSSKINLYQKLNYFNYISDSSINKHCQNSLCLLGPFLSWKSQLNITNAPIFKIPVYLQKENANKFSIILKDKHFSFNKVLLFYLEHFFNIKINAEQIFTSVNYALHYLIEKLRINNIDIQFLKYKYEVKYEEESLTSQFSIYDFMFLDLIEPENLDIYKDYNKVIKNFNENKLITSLLSKELQIEKDKLKPTVSLDSIIPNLLPFQTEQTVSEVIKQIELHDISKIEAIYAFENYKNILNIITYFLVEGKSILFVSENENILNFLHSELSHYSFKNKLAKIPKNCESKLEIYDHIFTQSDEIYSDFNKEKFDYYLNNLKKSKFEINEMTRILQEKHLKSGLANFEIIHKVFFARQELFDNTVYQKFGYIEWHKLENILEDINGIQYFYNRLNNNLDSPWRFKLVKTLKNKKIFDELQEIKTTIHNLKGKKTYLEYKYQQFLHQHSIKDNLNAYLSFLQKFKDQIDISYDYRLLWENKINFLTELPRLKNEIEHHMHELDALKSAASIIKEGTSLENVQEIISYFSNLTQYAKWFTRKYWSYRRKAKQLCPTWDGTLKIFTDYENYLKCYHNLLACISKIKHHSYLEVINNDSLTDNISKICHDLNFITHLFQEATDCFTMEHSNNMVDSYYSYKNVMQILRELDDIDKQVTDCEDHILQEWQKLGQYIQIEKIQLPTTEKKLSFINILIDRMNDIDFIHQYNKIIANLQEKYQLINLDIEIIESLSAYKIQWKEVVYASVIIGWFNDILQYNPSLKTYGRECIENLSLEYLEANEYVKANLFSYYENKFPYTFSNIKEHKIYRQMLAKLLEENISTFNPEEKKLFKSLKTAWFLTPHAVSQYLPFENNLFDLLIIDTNEKLQFEKYIPALFRAQKVIKCAFEKHIHTNYLLNNKLSTDNQNIKNDYYSNLFSEHISLRFQSQIETKQEALLSFINHAFYDGELFLACKPDANLSTQSIEYYEVIFQLNKYKEEQFFEVNEIVAWLKEHLLATDDDTSYAIVTTSYAQLNFYNEVLYSMLFHALEQEISIVELQHKVKIVHYLSIYSQKYDVALFAIANFVQQGKADYTSMLQPFKDSNIKKVLSNLTALINDKLIVINPFPLYLIETNDSSYSENYNLCILGRFLKYIKALATKQNEKALHILKSFKAKPFLEQPKSTEFALFVKEKLQSAGYKVAEMFGYNNVYLDLVVFHPSVEQDILLGIECDECLSHAAHILTDKLNIRDKILIQNGWNLEKIYAVDWLKNPDFEFKRLLQVIQSLVDCYEIHKKQNFFALSEQENNSHLNYHQF